jgi:2-polyprenyl-3-methyl-5-hydroxy-6-metoxy-1,4-benzoquinol methylase
MYAESREVASTPEMWTERFARSGRMRPWGALRMRLMPEWRLIKKYVPGGHAVLDAGCGIGNWARLMSLNGRRVTGLDYSSDLIRRLEVNYPSETWKLGDVRSMPFDGNVFDAVISWGIIEHDVEGPQAALREFHRVLAPGGIVIVSVPNDSAVRRRLAAADAARRPAGSGTAFFQYFMKADELVAEVRRAGFEVIESGTLRWPHLDLALPRASARLPQRLLYIASALFPLIAFWWRRFDRSIYCVGRRQEENG